MAKIQLINKFIFPLIKGLDAHLYVWDTERPYVIFFLFYKKFSIKLKIYAHIFINFIGTVRFVRAANIQSTKFHVESRKSQGTDSFHT